MNCKEKVFPIGEAKMTTTVKLKIKKDDRVRVLRGKDKGKEGLVLKCFPNEEKLIVEGINIIKRHNKPSKSNPHGGIIEKEAPVHVSKIALICPNCGKASKIGIKTDASGSKTRICKKCKGDIA